MKFKSAILTQASGSVGGATFSHNKGGMYIRARATPTNPNSPQQQAVRAIMAALTSHWLTTLTEGQRTDWATYADNVPLPDVLGENRNIPALAHYVRCNVPRLQVGSSRIDDAPIDFNLGTFTAPAIDAIDAATDKATFSWEDTDEWREADGVMIISVSRPQNPSINYFKGPYRYNSTVPGAGPPSPAEHDLVFPCAPTQRVFVQFRFSQADGRLSLPFRIFGTAA